MAASIQSSVLAGDIDSQRPGLLRQGPAQAAEILVAGPLEDDRRDGIGRDTPNAVDVPAAGREFAGEVRDGTRRKGPADHCDMNAAPPGSDRLAGAGQRLYFHADAPRDLMNHRAHTADVRLLDTQQDGQDESTSHDQLLHVEDNGPGMTQGVEKGSGHAGAVASAEDRQQGAVHNPTLRASPCPRSRQGHSLRIG